MDIQEVYPVPEWQQPVMFYGKPLTFNPKSHRYTWDGRHVPSVTTILRRLDKPQLVQWAANCAVDHIKEAGTHDAGTGMWEVSAGSLEAARKAHTVIRDKAADVGTLIHDIARTSLGGDEWHGSLSKLTGEAARALQAFTQWRSQHRIQAIALERRVFSAELMYAGTTDFYGYIDDEPCILDFKTGNGVYDEAWYQLAGYETALQEELLLNHHLTHWIVHLGKSTGECRTYRRSPEETAAAHSAWSCLVALDKAIRAMPRMERAA
jgi:hypothetical protein